MNGDLGKVYAAINKIGKDVAVLVERQANQHTENKNNIRVIEKFMNNCPVQRLSGQVKYRWLILSGLFIGLALMWVKG